MKVPRTPEKNGESAGKLRGIQKRKGNHTDETRNEKERGSADRQYTDWQTRLLTNGRKATYFN